MIEPVHVFNSQCHKYKEAFEVFLRHTNQKEVAGGHLTELIESMPNRKRMIDVGAGDGILTSQLSPLFEETLAMEPNPAMAADLRDRCENIKVLEKRIDDVHVSLHADLILCSHVLYYIDQSHWLKTIEKLSSWLSPGGKLVIILQNPNTDCMRMVEYLYQDRFDLSQLAQRFDIFAGHRYRQDIHTLSSKIEAPDFDTAYSIAEFVLNVVPMQEPVPRELLSDHVNRFFGSPDGRFRFSCHQDFLTIESR